MTERLNDATPVADWEDVTLTLLFANGNKVGHQTVRLVRSEIEAQERQEATDRANEVYAADDPRKADVLEEIEAFTLTPAEFQDRILRNAQRMVTSPVQVAGNEPHEFKILPPWAVKGLVIEVNNLKSRIVQA